MLGMTKESAQAIVAELSAKKARTLAEQALLAQAIEYLANNWR